MKANKTLAQQEHDPKHIKKCFFKKGIYKNIEILLRPMQYL